MNWFSYLPCTPAVTSDHRTGEEAATVKVTVSQTCSAVAYNSQTLAEKARTFLAAQAIQNNRNRIQFVWHGSRFGETGKRYEHTTPPRVLIVSGDREHGYTRSPRSAQQQIKEPHCRKDSTASIAAGSIIAGHCDGITAHGRIWRRCQSSKKQQVYTHHARCRVAQL